MGDDILTFQDMILRLERYWADKGCTVMQPYDSEVGAGTFHTATLLRSVPPPGAPATRSPAAGPPTAATERIPTVCSTTISSKSS